jgi:hypothetical protein
MRCGLAGLLALSLMCCASVPAKAQQFLELTDTAGLPNAAGLGWGDYDGDGFADLFVAGHNQGYTELHHGPFLFRNTGVGSLLDVSESMGIRSDVIIEQDGVAWGDYDNDGDLDLLVGSGAGYPMLYRRDETQFVEVGEVAGFHVSFSAGRGVTWCDYDGDNLLEAFCSNIFGPGYLMENDGDGTFTEVSVASGMDPSNAGQSASWGDFSNDGWPDLVIARLAQPMLLFESNGDGTFTDVSDASGMSAYIDAYSAVWGDYDNDGWLDCYVTSGNYIEPQLRRDALFHNDGDGTFTDVSDIAGMAGDAANGIGAAWADYDNDGNLDIFVGNFGQPSFLYRNNGNGTFTDMFAGSGLDGDSHSGAVAWADMDRDGRLDLAQGTYNEATRLFGNISYGGNWLRLRALTNATGAATIAELPARDAIGARVDLNLDNDDAFPSGRTLTRMIDGGSGWCAQNEQVAHFGVATSSVVCVRVRFPDGSVVTHRSVPVNRQITIRDVPADRTEEVFDDIPLDFWAYEETKGCAEAGIVAGYPDGLYHGANPVTRDQMAVYVARALAGGDDNVPDFTDTPTFPDVGSEHWALKYVEHAVDQSVVGGYEDGTYHPEYDVDRGQMAVYIARALAGGAGNVPDPSGGASFPDVGSDFWAYRHIEYCVENGVVQGYLDGNYYPDNVVTRDQMAVYVARAFEL